MDRGPSPWRLRVCGWCGVQEQRSQFSPSVRQRQSTVIRLASLSRRVGIRYRAGSTQLVLVIPASMPASSVRSAASLRIRRGVSARCYRDKQFGGCARAHARVTYGEKFADLGERQAEALHALDEQHPVDDRRVVAAVRARRAVGRWQQADALVVAQRVRSHADAGGQVGDGQSAGVRGHTPRLELGVDSRVKPEIASRSPGRR